MTSSFAQVLSKTRRWVDEEFLLWLRTESGWTETSQKLASHVLVGAGKALRPALAIGFSNLLQKQSWDARPSKSVLRRALALEMIHTYSLVHDDLPAMDNDDWRRGRPTLHRMTSDASAILMGDALLTGAFEVLVSAPGTLSAAELSQSVKILSRAAGAAGMIEGQFADLAAEKISKSGDSASIELERIHRLKTGALMGASVALGALGSCSASRVNEIESWGVELGLLFQMVDDLLDVTSSSAELGKSIGKDERQQKLTYVSKWGVQELQKKITQFEKDLLAKRPAEFSETDLSELIRFVSQRKS